MSLCTYNIKEEDARAYDAMAWRFVRPRLNMNLSEIVPQAQNKMFAPHFRFVSQKDERCHIQRLRRLAIA
jgi:hypothetical protein